MFTLLLYVGLLCVRASILNLKRTAKSAHRLYRLDSIGVTGRERANQFRLSKERTNLWARNLQHATHIEFITNFIIVCYFIQFTLFNRIGWNMNSEIEFQINETYVLLCVERGNISPPISFIVICFIFISA